jgi:hypothetical protein
MCCDLGIAFDKPTIEIGKPQEALNVLDRRWSSPTLDGLNLRLVHGNASWRDHVAEELH